jgi:hypothetical protein
VISSPRRALDSTPPRSRALMKCSSASYADLFVMPTWQEVRQVGAVSCLERSA